MVLHLGNVPANSTLYIPFGSYNSDGASATLSGLAVTDVEIYKNGSTTQRSSDAGIALLDTDGIDFDGITGINGFSIDLSDNTDTGFYSVGSFYWVVVSSVTIDSQTVNFIAATFRIVAAENTTGIPAVDAVQVSGSSTAADNVETCYTGTITTFDGLENISAADVNAEVDTAISDYFGTGGDSLTAIPWNSAWDSEVQSEVTDALNAYDPPTKAEMDSGLAGLNDISVSDVWTTQLTESYASNGTAPTGAQAMFAIHQMLMDFTITSTSYTVRQLDGNTTAFTVTLDDAQSPTSATRT